MLMPIFGLIQIIASRVIIGLIALFTAFGLGTVSNPPARSALEETTAPIIQEVAPVTEEVPILPDTVIPETPKMGGGTVIETEQKADTPPSPAIQEETTVTSTSPAPTAVSEIPLSFSYINTETAKALVNILCMQRAAGAVTPITGSGVVIDSRGIVITNAHVAQYFLLKDYPVKDGLECILRTGSPARAIYTAELLYLPPIWISLHAHDIVNTEPKGTGEHDYAFLRITGRTDPSASLPGTFPFVPFDINDIELEVGDDVLAAAYPAGFLSGITIQKDLYTVSSIATIAERFTFVENTVDLISIGGTVVSQGGSSGGAAVSDKNMLVGIIVTSTKADTTAERDLRAITLGHINRSLSQYANTTIDGLLFGDLTLKAKLFNLSTASALTKHLEEYLDRR